MKCKVSSQRRLPLLFSSWLFFSRPALALWWVFVISHCDVVVQEPAERVGTAGAGRAVGAVTHPALTWACPRSPSSLRRTGAVSLPSDDACVCVPVRKLLPGGQGLGRGIWRGTFLSRTHRVAPGDQAGARSPPRRGDERPDFPQCPAHSPSLSHK